LHILVTKNVEKDFEMSTLSLYKVELEVFKLKEESGEFLDAIFLSLSEGFDNT